MRYRDRHVRIADFEKRLVYGYAVLWGEVRGNLKFESKQFSEENISLFLTNPVLVFNYDDQLVAGKVALVETDEVGLWCEAEIQRDNIWRLLRTALDEGLMVDFGLMGMKNDDEKSIEILAVSLEYGR